MSNAKNIDYMDEIDRLTTHTAQLSAMLNGMGFDSFNSFNEEIKQNYLWACSNQATEIDKIANQLSLFGKVIP